MRALRIKVLLTTIGGMALLALGMLGLLLPVWPTTQFVLGAVGCFACTPKWQERVLRLPMVRAYVQNYRNRRGLPRKTVAVRLAFLWGMLGFSCALVGNPWVVCGLVLVGCVVTAHILWIARERKR